MSDYIPPYRVYKKSIEYTYEKTYENFYLYRQVGTPFFECFKEFDLKKLEGNND